MTLQDLRAFVAAYQAKSISEAARQLGCTQAAVAQHIRRLEQELGVELFARLRRGVEPTSAGTTFYQVASGALVNLDVVVGEIGRSLKQRQDKLRLTTSGVILSQHLRRFIFALQERRPDVDIEIESEHTAEGRLNALREGRADLAMIPLTVPIQHLEVRPCMKIDLVLLVHPEHEFAKRKRLHLTDLVTMRYIAQSLGSATFRHIDRILRKAGIAIEPSHLVEDATAGTLMVELGHGETFVPKTDGARLERLHRVKALNVTSLPPLRMGWVARNFALLPDAAKEFLEICNDLMRGASNSTGNVGGAPPQC